MKTTLEIPDHLFREAKAKAALDTIKPADLVSFDAGFTRFRDLVCPRPHPQASLPKAYSS